MGEDLGKEAVIVALWRVHVELEDRPGRLGELATAVGRSGCNILSLHVVGEPADDGSVTDELLVKVPEGIEPAGMVAAVEQAGIPCSLLVRADATELADTATTALALARMVAADPGSAPQAVATLLRARIVEPGTPGVHTLRVGTAQVHLTRTWPFTATELSRAAALLELAAQLSLAGAPSPAASRLDPILLLRDGSEVRLRTATPADVPLIAAMHARSSPESRSARFLTAARRLEPEELDELTGPHSVLALTIDGGSAVGMVNLSRRSAFAVMVEDAWQGRGLGTALVRRVADLAADQGASELTAVTHTQNMKVTRLLRRAGLRPTAEISGGMLHVRAPLTATHATL
ncbi:GNAT family N-acetyltransferase [Pseudonocardia sp. WMMC193]|uniref:GNAT family N-acetyltransferase n=1 Tax=Pseudonocardia sp. WMMC193 TaxID=2911965 RepID=UPI001F3D91F6|nr:GNAT family N-acetyltransferase [Pseudonocardia sp. WMMC193]MCF7551642.1 GNAT family N-acetyltransferase [Pseudonocardia sp. WMMC193]